MEGRIEAGLTGESPTFDLADASEAEVRSAVGRNANYYLGKWRRAKRAGFNWAAFFLSGIWLPYRKMFRPALVLYAVVIAESVLEQLVFVRWLGMQDTPRALDHGVQAAVSWTCGAFGNTWYRNHVRRLITTSRASQPNEPQLLQDLGRRGGTSVVAALGFFTLFILGIFAAMFLEEAVFGSGS